MKAYLIALLGLSAGIAFGQIPGPVPPAAGTWADARASQYKNRLRQPPPPPAGGFWVVEKNTKGPVVVRFYTDQQRELRTDTLRHKHPNLKNRVVVERLNERLASLLDARPTANPVALRQP